MMQIEKSIFGKTIAGKEVVRYTLTNSIGTQVSIINLGATIQSIQTADRDGNYTDIVLGCDSVSDYEQQQAYLGAICGRFANRIRAGKFTLDGKAYQLAVNNGSNHLHGGLVGFNQHIWSIRTEQTDHAASVILSFLSSDRDEGYPGNLNVEVRYTLCEHNKLTATYRASTDKTTIVNLTNHAYFNLRGHGDCLEHQLRLRSDKFLPTDITAIPTGEMRSVTYTPMDFRDGKAIGLQIDDSDEQLTIAAGYDHTWVLDRGDKDKPFAFITEPESGRTMSVTTTQPGVQFYSGNYLVGNPGRNGTLSNREGFCLETQHFPDSPNQPEFPSCVLKPLDAFEHTTVFQFGVLH